MELDDIYDDIASVGEKVEDLEFEYYQNGKFAKASLSDYQGKWLVILFYPADFTFICPTELGEMANYYSKFKEEGCEVISVSTDTVFAHKAWHDSSPTIKNITFPMAADPTAELSRYFNTYIESAGISLRGTFIISPDSVLKSAEINDNSIGRSAKELLRKVQAAKFVEENDGQVCPASWTPGGDTLQPGEDLVNKI